MPNLDNNSKRLIKDPDTRWVWIKYQLQLQGRSLAQVAHDAGVTRQCVYKVGLMTYPRMEKVIADALDMAPKDLFPERYDQETGLPHYRKGRPFGAKTKRRVKPVSKDSTGKKNRNVDDSHRNGHRKAA